MPAASRRRSSEKREWPKKRTAVEEEDVDGGFFSPFPFGHFTVPDDISLVYLKF